MVPPVYVWVTLDFYLNTERIKIKRKNHHRTSNFTHCTIFIAHGSELSKAKKINKMIWPGKNRWKEVWRQCHWKNIHLKQFHATESWQLIDNAYVWVDNKRKCLFFFFAFGYLKFEHFDIDWDRQASIR